MFDMSIKERLYAEAFIDADQKMHKTPHSSEPREDAYIDKKQMSRTCNYAKPDGNGNRITGKTEF